MEKERQGRYNAANTTDLRLTAARVKLMTKDIWDGRDSRKARRIPRALWPVVQRKLDQIDAVTRATDLGVPPANGLRALSGKMAGYHAIRVDDRFSIVFRFDGHDAYDVRCTDQY